MEAIGRKICVSLAAICFVLGSAGAVQLNSISTPKIQTAVRKSENTVVQWKSKTNVSGYQIRFSEKNNAENAVTVTVSGADRYKKTIKSMDKSKSYYIWLRTYKKQTGPNRYSEWSTPCKVVAWKSHWSYAKKSKIHSDSATLYFTDSAKPKDKTVCINAGHGTKGGESVRTLCHPDGSPKVTGGSTGAGTVTATAIASGTDMKDGTAEAVVALKLAKEVKKQLLDSGYNVLMVRETDDAQLDNIARTVFANKNADCHISLHYDSTSNNKGAFAISVPDVASYKEMYPVSDHWREHNELGRELISGLERNSVKIYGGGSMALDLTQTSYSKIPSVDLEVGDRASDYSKKTLSKLAKGIVSGLNSYFK